MQSSLEHKPMGKWAFDQSVTSVFDDMLKRSIPQYELMRTTTSVLAKKFIENDSYVLDLGCSKGDSFHDLVDEFPGAYFIGLDTSKSMIDAAKHQFTQDNVRFMVYDIKNDFPIQTGACLILSVLTLQFVPIEYRQSIIQNIYDTLSPGGAFIFVEKVLGNTAHIDQLLVKLYYEMKAGNGYTQEAIQEKRTSLEGVLVPVTAKWNEDLLTQVGFNQIDCFWRCLNFAGWVAIK